MINTSSDLGLKSKIVKIFPHRGNIFNKDMNLKAMKGAKRIFFYISVLQHVVFAL